MHDGAGQLEGELPEVPTGGAGARDGLSRGRRVERVPHADERADEDQEIGERFQAEQAAFAIDAASDVVAARRHLSELAVRAGFNRSDVIVLETVLAEVAANMISFAGRGEIVFRTEREGGHVGMVVVARDGGPGIPDVAIACEDGYSTIGRPGLGLGAVRRLMDAFDVASAPGDGTTITMRKWRDIRG